MFDQLSQKIQLSFQQLKRKGLLTENDINQALREVRIALLEADVALPVTKSFIDDVRQSAVGKEVVKSVSPAQMVIKIVHDHLCRVLGSESESLNLNHAPPTVIMMVGLQGSGKTTSTAKIAKYVKKTLRKKTLLASLDVYRPAAREQLAKLASEISSDAFPIDQSNDPAVIAKKSYEQAMIGGYDVLFLDTAGRLHIDDKMMIELKTIQDIVKPHEIIFVADALTGQDAVNSATSFSEVLPLTGVMLTRIDGDGRGGAALSIKKVTNCPIKFLGIGEKLDQIEVFHPERIASRILDMGDIVSIVEKAAEHVTEADALTLEKKIKKGQFDFNDLLQQLKMMQKMGGISSILKLLPGMKNIQDQIDKSGVSDKNFKQLEAIVLSMTLKERKYPKLLNASRKKRIARGSGTNVEMVNRLIKQHKQMGGMMKKLSKMDKKSLSRSSIMNMLPK